jgi:hypothetical protein
MCVECHKSPEYREQRNAYLRTHPTHVVRALERQASPEGKLQQHRKQLHYLYKLTPKRLAEMHAAQGNCCAACGEPVEGRMDVDHDHACCADRRSCGECLRELLCRRCNTILGKVHDRVEILEALIGYLQKHDARGY